MMVIYVSTARVNVMLVRELRCRTETRVWVSAKKRVRFATVSRNTGRFRAVLQRCVVSLRWTSFGFQSDTEELKEGEPDPTVQVRPAR